MVTNLPLFSSVGLPSGADYELNEAFFDRAKETAEGILYIDTPGENKLQRFRVFKGVVALKGTAGESISKLVGISSSSQPSLSGLRQIRSSIATDRPILVVDLRAETHVLLMSDPKSELMHGVRLASDLENSANKGLSAEQILRKERQLVDQINTLGEVAIYRSAGKKRVSSERTPVAFALTEASLVRSQGMEYIRVPSIDHTDLSEASVAKLLEIFNKYKDSHWIHFHCHQGRGRAKQIFTRLFISMHAKTFSFEELHKRLEDSYSIKMVKPIDPNLPAEKLAKKMAKAAKKVNWKGVYDHYSLNPVHFTDQRSSTDVEIRGKPLSLHRLI